MENMTEKQLQAFNMAKEGKSLFITGGAGVGKSYVVRKIINELQKEKQIIVCAPTGTAATQIGGTTIHKAFGFPTTTCITNGKTAKIVVRAPKLIRAADVIVIDEISMCSLNLFDAIIKSVQKAEKKANKKIQLIIVGDFFQLPPVIRSDNGDKQQIENFYKFRIYNGFAFQSIAWAKLGLVSVELTEVVRQKETEFVRQLNRLRKGDDSCIDYFNTKSSKTELDDSIWLFPYNKQVREFNERKIEKLSGKKYVFDTIFEGDIDEEYKKGTVEPLILKEGAKVIITVNHTLLSGRIDDVLYDVDKRRCQKKGLYYNGSTGEVCSIVQNLNNPSDDYIMILLDDGELVYIYRKKENIYEYFVDEKNIIHKKIVGAYYQFPILLAYAMTIFRAQGKTLKKANIYPTCRCVGELYVAISRVEKIENVYFSSLLTPYMIMTDSIVCTFYEHIDDSNFLLERDYISGESTKMTVCTEENTDIKKLKNVVGRPKRFPCGSKNIRVPFELEGFVQEMIDSLYPKDGTYSDKKKEEFLRQVQKILKDL